MERNFHSLTICAGLCTVAAAVMALQVYKKASPKRKIETMKKYKDQNVTLGYGSYINNNTSKMSTVHHKPETCYSAKNNVELDAGLPTNISGKVKCGENDDMYSIHSSLMGSQDFYHFSKWSNSSLTRSTSCITILSESDYSWTTAASFTSLENGEDKELTRIFSIDLMASRDSFDYVASSQTSCFISTATEYELHSTGGGHRDVICFTEKCSECHNMGQFCNCIPQFRKSSKSEDTNNNDSSTGATNIETKDLSKRDDELNVIEIKATPLFSDDNNADVNESSSTKDNKTTVATENTLKKNISVSSTGKSSFGNLSDALEVIDKSPNEITQITNVDNKLHKSLTKNKKVKPIEKQQKKNRFQKPKKNETKESEPLINVVRVVGNSISFYGTREKGKQTACSIKSQIRIIPYSKDLENAKDSQEDNFGSKSELQVHVKTLQGLTVGKLKIYIKIKLMNKNISHKKLKAKSKPQKCSTVVTWNKHLNLKRISKSILQTGTLIVEVWSSAFPKNKRMCSVDIDLTKELNFGKAYEDTNLVDTLIDRRSRWTDATFFLS